MKNNLFLPTCRAALAAAAAILSVSPAFAAEGGPGPAARIVFSGERQSELAPCGCRLAQTGGTPFEAAYVAALRRQPAPLFVVDAGGFVDASITPNEFLKTFHLMRAMRRMDCETVNVGATEAALGKDFLKQAAARNNFQLVSSNLLDPKSRKPVFAASVVKSLPQPDGGKPLRIGVAGVAYPRGAASAPSTQTASRPAAPPMPTPRVSPTPTERKTGERFYWQPQVGQFERWARFTPTPTPLSPQEIKVLEALERHATGAAPTPAPTSGPTAEDAGRQRLDELRKKLMEDETTFTPQRGAPATVPSAPPPAPSPAPSPKPATTPQALNKSGQFDPFSVPRPRKGETVLEDPAAALARILPDLRRDTDWTLLLVSGTADQAAALARKFPELGAVVCADWSAPGPAPPKSTRPAVVSTGIMGRWIGSLELVKHSPSGSIQTNTKLLPVNKDLGIDPATVGILDEYRADTARLLPPQPHGASQTLAGAAACKECHPKPQAQWAATRHSRALDSLQAHGNQYNPDCLPCHVTSYRKDNGFYDVRATPRMANVQCEACHGPALRHVTDMRLREDAARLNERQLQLLDARMAASRPRKQPTKETCQACHTPERDDRFDYKAKLAKVRHEED